MGILAVHITTAKIRAFHDNQAALGYLGHPGQIGGWWVPQNDVTMEAVRADDYFPLTPFTELLRARADYRIRGHRRPHAVSRLMAIDPKLSVRSRRSDI